MMFALLVDQPIVALLTPSSSPDLTLNNKTVVANITSTGDLRFKTLQAVRAQTDAPLPEGGSDLPNTGVTVLAIDVPAGNQTVSVIFTPDSSNDTAFTTPKQVALDAWNLTSHNAPTTALKSGSSAAGTDTQNATNTQSGTDAQNTKGSTKENSARRDSSPMSFYVLSLLFALGAYFYPSI